MSDQLTPEQAAIVARLIGAIPSSVQPAKLRPDPVQVLFMDRIFKLEEEVAALRKDKARLDTLERANALPGGWAVEVQKGFAGLTNRWVEGAKDIREAIDFAIQMGVLK